MSTTFQNFKRKLPDCSGICLSSFCLIHCVITPLAGIVQWIEIPLEHWVHEILVLSSIVLTLMAMYRAHTDGHSRMALRLLASGLVALTAGELFFHEFVILKLSAVLLITSGHVVNLVKRRRRSHRC